MTFVITMGPRMETVIREFPDRNAAEEYLGIPEENRNKTTIKDVCTIIRDNDKVHIIPENTDMELHSIIPGGEITTKIIHNSEYDGIGAEYCSKSSSAYISNWGNFIPGVSLAPSNDNLIPCIAMEKKKDENNLLISSWDSEHTNNAYESRIALAIEND